MEQPSVEADIHAQQRMKQMYGFIELMTHWMDDVLKMDSSVLTSLMQMGSKVQKLLQIKDKMKVVLSGKNQVIPATKMTNSTTE